MPRICYVERKFSASSMALIDISNAIIEEYRAQGFDLTLRQLYYQHVSRDVIPNTDREYKRLGSIINDARLAGLVDWDAIVDRTRNLRTLAHWDTPSDILRAVASQFRIDKWDRQRYRPECWIEKDALIGVIQGVCNRYDVPFFSCRGYTSQSEMWAASQRHSLYRRNGQEPLIIHLGDHDPSGIDMSRDIMDRLELFVGSRVEVRRIALNMDQVEQYSPPPNPAKLSDSRASDYVQKYGDDSWELDALEPSVLSSLIEQIIVDVRDEDAWRVVAEAEAEGRTVLGEVSDRWEEIVQYLSEESR